MRILTALFLVMAFGLSAFAWDSWPIPNGSSTTIVRATNASLNELGEAFNNGKQVTFGNTTTENIVNKGTLSNISGVAKFANVTAGDVTTNNIVNNGNFTNTGKATFGSTTTIFTAPGNVSLSFIPYSSTIGWILKGKR